MKERFKNLIKQTVRDLRKNQTNSEELLWEIIRNRKLLGKKFLRRHPLIFNWYRRKRFIVADFYCHETKLIIELDGAVHDRQKDYDKARDYVSKSLGIKVLRFDNDDIKNNIHGVIETIKEELTTITPSLHKRGGKGGEL